ncbi:hypothetical protein BC831DRAFT_472442, partial [Entophlyctis helioformis]
MIAHDREAGLPVNLLRCAAWCSLWIERSADYYRGKLKGAFLKKRDLQDPADIEKAIAHGEFVYRELEALWFVRKYRAMKRSYYDDSGAKLDSLLDKLTRSTERG